MKGLVRNLICRCIVITFRDFGHNVVIFLLLVHFWLGEIDQIWRFYKFFEDALKGWPEKGERRYIFDSLHWDLSSLLLDLGQSVGTVPSLMLCFLCTHHCSCNNTYAIVFHGEFLIIVYAVLRPCGYNLFQKLFTSCLYQVMKYHLFTPIIDKLSKNKLSAMVVGDFNTDLLKIDERWIYMESVYLLCTHGLFSK